MRFWKKTKVVEWVEGFTMTFEEKDQKQVSETARGVDM